MNIGGYQKLTLIDYPGELATTVFTVSCSFRCPFCHNPELVAGSGYDLSLQKKKEKEFFDFLKKRKGTLTGVCITGGEPTVQPDIIEFIKKVKKLGYLVKLDTNGTRPDVVRKVISEKLVDYIAMDIKNSQKKYLKTAGLDFSNKLGSKAMLERIILSAELIMHSRVPYEFRTTAVPGLHTEKDFEDIAKWIKGAENYWIQKYREERILDENLKKKTKGKKLNLEKIKKSIAKNFGKIGIRG